ncbi:IS110 family RNA-guided transposase [Streptomonospora litoralis]|uniref:Transposase n=1 Tax=Streptomonospora litoralis TaxID=2498135 RepID=A0A4P6PZW6_9ACTN|nr:IS110 family transposase [Streptomonospora litoralis]QBI53808.1 Transposase [Streptomonospora litoralis]
MMDPRPGDVIAGVDTHTDTHHCAIIDHLGRPLADREFPTTATGYDDLAAWTATHGHPIAVAMEGTGSYGAELTRRLTAAGHTALEVNRPDRSARRRHGKSDPLDAYAAARAALADHARAAPKDRTGTAGALRPLHHLRTMPVGQRTQTINQIHALITTTGQDLRALLRGLSTTRLIRACADLEPHAADPAELADPDAAARYSLAALARHYQDLTRRITEIARHIDHLTATAAPGLRALVCVGPQSAAQLMLTTGDNPDRITGEAAFAHLCGTAPVPASSGRRDRHRLNRGGDRAANKVLHQIVIARMRHDGDTRAYVQRRLKQGLTKKDIIRCLKRYVARQVYKALTRTGHQRRHLYPSRLTNRSIDGGSGAGPVVVGSGARRWRLRRGRRSAAAGRSARLGPSIANLWSQESTSRGHKFTIIAGWTGIPDIPAPVGRRGVAVLWPGPRRLDGRAVWRGRGCSRGSGVRRIGGRGRRHVARCARARPRGVAPPDGVGFWGSMPVLRAASAGAAATRRTKS